MKAGSTRVNQKYNIVVKDGPDGTFRIAIVMTGLRLKRLRQNFIQIAEIEAEFPASFNYRGHRFKPRLILKLHRKFPPKMAKKLNMKIGPHQDDRFL